MLSFRRGLWVFEDKNQQRKYYVGAYPFTTDHRYLHTV